MRLNVIDCDKEQLSADRISSSFRMTQSTRPIQERGDNIGRGNPATIETKDTTECAPVKSYGGPRLVADAKRPKLTSQTDPFVTLTDYRTTYGAAKRVFDFFGGLALLMVSAPIILIAAVAIRLESKGSPFFVQTRLGKNGRPFKIFKLRGMFIDAKARFPTYYDYSSRQDLDFYFHHEFDPRVTRAGNFIRKTSIDELPNFWNVVVGDLSLVGPRPEIPEVLALYGAYREEYLSVKPGVTCLSKCTGRDRLTKRETIEYDLDYVRRRSFNLDLQILWRTFRGVVLRRDVY